MKEKKYRIIISGLIILIFIMGINFLNQEYNLFEKKPQQETRISCTIPYNVFMSNETWDVSIVNGTCNFELIIKGNFLE